MLDILSKILGQRIGIRLDTSLRAELAKKRGQPANRLALKLIKIDCLQRKCCILLQQRIRQLMDGRMQLAC